MDTTVLTPYIQSNQSRLNLSFKKQFIEDNLATIVDFFKYDQTITELDLSYNDIGTENTFPIESILEILSNNSTIQSIKLGTNNLRSEHIEILARALENNTSLTSIRLDNNSIGNEGIEILARGLYNNYSINKISLKSCGITSNGIIELSRVLKQRRILTKLKLHDHITDDGIIELASAPVSKLEIFSNEMTNECLLPLVSNPLIEFLDIYSDNITDDGIFQIRDSLKYNTSLRFLRLVSDQIGEIGILALSEVLDFNFTIETIIMYGDLHQEIIIKLLENKVKRRAQQNIYSSVLTIYENICEQYIQSEIIPIHTIPPFTLEQILSTLPN